MAHLLRQYLCCCLPASSPDPHNDDERQPLLNPDILPARLIFISSPSFLPSSHPPSASPAPSSRSSSPTLRSTLSQPSSPSTSTRTATWRVPADDPPALVRARVVKLGPDWEELARPPARDGEGAWETPRRRGAKGRGRGGGGTGRSRPPSSHSLKTLPRGGGGGTRGVQPQPSPLRRKATGSSGGLDGDGADVDGAPEDEDDDDGQDGEDDSRFDTVASWRTARSGTVYGSAGGSTGEGYASGRVGLRDMWGGAEEERGEELTAALARLEADLDSWTLPDVGPLVADLGDDAGARGKDAGGGGGGGR
ncbi:hypothetical protein JCM10207_003877 [Rhodosporidiobolus poonsookiae]